ncbi:MAG: hypothetical protein ACRCXZ_01930, partial [Patescibacteria group bacterium]
MLISIQDTSDIVNTYNYFIQLFGLKDTARVFPVAEEFRGVFRDGAVIIESKQVIEIDFNRFSDKVVIQIVLEQNEVLDIDFIEIWFSCDLAKCTIITFFGDLIEVDRIV